MVSFHQRQIISESSTYRKSHWDPANEFSLYEIFPPSQKEGYEMGGRQERTQSPTINSSSYESPPLTPSHWDHGVSLQRAVEGICCPAAWRTMTTCELVSTVCGCDLAQGGFFIKNGEYLCTLDYQRVYGTRCHGCGEFVEGEVVTALGKTYHPNCFACTICK